MKNIYGILAGFLVVACLLGAGCTGTQEEQTTGPAITQTEKYSFTIANNNETQTIPQGSIVEIKLDENPTTGYSWNLTAEGLNVTTDEYKQNEAPEAMVGVGAVHTWEMTAENKGTFKVEAVYKRPWEETTGDEETFTLTLDIV